MTFFFNSSHSFEESTAKLGTKMASWLHKPRKLLKAVISFGTRNSAMAAKCLGEGKTPLLLTTKPENSTELPISNFFCDKINLLSAQCWSTTCSFFSKSSRFLHFDKKIVQQLSNSRQANKYSVGTSTKFIRRA